MKNIPKIKFETPPGESRYDKKISELKDELETLKHKLQESEKRLELAVLRIPKVIEEIRIERQNDAPPSGAEAELAMFLKIKQNDRRLSEDLREKIKGTGKMIADLTALNERFRGTPSAKA